jgi:hypothetical protein
MVYYKHVPKLNKEMEMFAVFQNGKQISAPVQTRAEAEQLASDYARGDWEATHCITPTVRYTVQQV